MQVANENNRCFIVWSNEIERRFDPHYYMPEFRELAKRIRTLKYKTKQTKDFASVICGPFGSSIKVNDYKNFGIPLIRIANITKNQELTSNNTIFISEKLAEKLKAYKVKKDDLIISQRGTLGLVAKIPDFFDGGVISANFIAIKDIKEVSPDYLKFFLSSEYGRKQLVRKISGQVQTKITTDDIKSIIVSIPPLQVQIQIVGIMGSAYKQKAEKEREAEKLLNSVDDYILGELNIKMPEVEDRECFSISSKELDGGRLDCYYYQPKFKEGEKSLKKANCKVEPLKNYITKIHYGASLKNNYVEEGIPLLRIQNLKPNKIVLDDVVKISEARRKELGNAFVSEGDLLISRSGSVGIVSVVPKEAEGFAFGSFMIKFCLNDKIDKDFISVWLNNKISQLFIKREKIGAIQGNITIETIENLQIPTPPLEIQKRLAGEVKGRITQAEEMKSEAKNEIEKAKQEVEKIILGK